MGGGPGLAGDLRDGRRVRDRAVLGRRADHAGDALGTDRAQVGQPNDPSWTVLADPEGNEFCVLSSRNS
ncbi:VOC family protein [Kribbella deserti]|uniref:VOC family protein n=1 Tax=Kribbella deserti TaxID=1926257 RepID=A0ABV6QG43_9ACTN